MSNGASLPPLPKLRPRPDLPGHVYPDVTIIQLIDPDEDDDDDEEEEEETIPPPQLKRRKVDHCVDLSMKRDDESDAVTPPMPTRDDATLNRDEGDNYSSQLCDDSAKTSRLLTKNDCRGGRKRNSGSIIHSIPKFSQVKMFL